MTVTRDAAWAANPSTSSWHPTDRCSMSRTSPAMVYRSSTPELSGRPGSSHTVAKAPLACIPVATASGYFMSQTEAPAPSRFSTSAPGRRVATWHIGGSPDMGGVSADGRQLGGCRDAATVPSRHRHPTGRLIHRIARRLGPHGLAVFRNRGAGLRHRRLPLTQQCCHAGVGLDRRRSATSRGPVGLTLSPGVTTRTRVIMRTVPAAGRHAHWKDELLPVGASRQPCTVATAKIRQLERCTACQRRREIRRTASEVNSTARTEFYRDDPEGDGRPRPEN